MGYELRCPFLYSIVKTKSTILKFMLIWLDRRLDLVHFLNHQLVVRIYLDRAFIVQPDMSILTHCNSLAGHTYFSPRTKNTERKICMVKIARFS